MVRLNGVSKHQDFAEVFSATTEKHWEKDLTLIEEIGANAIRLSHYQHPEQVYNLCDEMGFVVWAEIPLLKMIENKSLYENAQQQLTELILQNIHHPSICFWGIQNEVAMFGEEAYMYDELETLNSLAKKLDASQIGRAHV